MNLTRYIIILVCLLSFGNPVSIYFIPAFVTVHKSNSSVFNRLKSSFGQSPNPGSIKHFSILLFKIKPIKLRFFPIISDQKSLICDGGRVGKLKHRAGFLESLQGGGEENPVYRDQVGFQD